jgi:hypothetical protein
MIKQLILSSITMDARHYRFIMLLNVDASRQAKGYYVTFLDLSMHGFPYDRAMAGRLGRRF